MKLSKNKGFTLLEIIIVIIIVGVLASLALPRFFSTIEFSRSTEALRSMGAIKDSIRRCAAMDNNGALCAWDSAWNNVDLTDFAAEPGAHFTYAWTITRNSPPAYTITAVRNTLDGGTPTSVVALGLIAATNTIARTGVTAFKAIR